MNEVYIVGGGPSLINYNWGQLSNKDCIAINRSIIDIPFAKYFITIDYTFLNKISKSRHIFDSSTATKIFVANFSSPNLVEHNGQIKDVKHNILYDLSPYDMIIKSSRREGIGATFKHFCNGDNSGHCGLQLALLLGYDRINLLGFDMMITSKTHYHTDYSISCDKMRQNLARFKGFYQQALFMKKQLFPNVTIINHAEIRP